MKNIIVIVGLLSLFIFTNSNAYWLLSKSNEVSEIKNKQDLLLVFSMKKSYWDDGKPIILVVLPSNNKLHQDFIQNNLGINSSILDNIWDMNIYSGNKKPPIVVKTKAAMIELIKNTDGAIGYVYSNHIPGVNSIEIDELFEGDQ